MNRDLLSDWKAARGRIALPRLHLGDCSLQRCHAGRPLSGKQIIDLHKVVGSEFHCMSINGSHPNRTPPAEDTLRQPRAALFSKSGRLCLEWMPNVQRRLGAPFFPIFFAIVRIIGKKDSRGYWGRSAPIANQWFSSE
jgi:hypothetical protein